MTLSASQRRANDKYIRENYRQVKLSMPKAEAEELDAYCTARNLSKAGFIRAAIKEKMEREGADGSTNSMSGAVVQREGAVIAGSSPQGPQTAPEGSDCDTEMSGTGTARRRTQKRLGQPQAGAADGVDTPGVDSIFSAQGEDTSSPSCLFTHIEAPPDPIDIGAWNVWVHRRKGEPVDSWRQRVKASIPDDYLITAERLHYLQGEDHDLILSGDPKSQERFWELNETLMRQGVLDAYDAEEYSNLMSYLYRDTDKDADDDLPF